MRSIVSPARVRTSRDSVIFTRFVSAVILAAEISADTDSTSTGCNCSRDVPPDIGDGFTQMPRSVITGRSGVMTWLSEVAGFSGRNVFERLR